jgi:hypothetical protein
MRFPPDLEECFQGTIESRVVDRLSSVRVGNVTRSSEEGPLRGVVHLIETRDLNAAIQMAAKIAMARRMSLGGPSHIRSSSDEVLVHDLP